MSKYDNLEVGEAKLERTREVYRAHHGLVAIPRVDTCSKERLVEIVEDIVGALYEDDDGPNPDVEWEVDTIERVAEILSKHKLVPENIDG